MNTYEREMQIGREIAKSAGDLALQYRASGISVDAKADESPVTVADRECERLIASRLLEAFPEDGLLGEEGALKDSTNQRKWIIDPIDGTRDFIRGTGAWSVLIGLEEKTEVVAGFAYFPVTGRMYSAAKGRGAECNGEKISISSVDAASKAMLCCNGLSFMHRYPFANDLVEWFSTFWTVRSMGGCLDAMFVSSGVAEVWVEAQAKPWDLAPLKIIAEEAGARTFDFEGKNTIYGGNFVITVPALAEELLRFLARRERV